jgi:hypothetical protein
VGVKAIDIEKTARPTIRGPMPRQHGTHREMDGARWRVRAPPDVV